MHSDKQGRIQDLSEGVLDLFWNENIQISKGCIAGEIFFKIVIFYVLHWVFFPLSAIEIALKSKGSRGGLPSPPTDNAFSY